MNPNVKMLLEKEADITADPLPLPHPPPPAPKKADKYCWEQTHVHARTPIIFLGNTYGWNSMKISLYDNHITQYDQFLAYTI